jgi:AsmA-like C-terminal region
MHYEATLKNATPPGLIDAKGEFGPWQKDDPGSTSVSGNYTFQKADLSVFKGISGTLSSVGDFKGVLERIDAKGTTDTPDFMVRTGSQPVHLKTQFHAVIDGTSGDTLLQPVKARFGRTEIICNGGITKHEGDKGKSVILDVKLEKGRIEDLLKLAVPSKPFMTGAIRFNAKFDLPPGDKDVVEKLNLNGTFAVENAQFTTSTVQDQIEKLSRRTRGIHDDSTDERIVSDLKGGFVLRKGTITLSNLSFAVPGAQVNLDGDYGLVSQEIDFQGTLQMQAKLSETQTGIKSLLLKAVDPFFKKGTSGAVIPIKIGGKFKNPSFGLNLHGSGKKSQ